MDERDEILHVDLKGRDPDEGFTGVPYEKGRVFKRIRRKSRARKIRPFRARLFRQPRFQSITTETFVDYLQKKSNRSKSQVSVADVNEWIRESLVCRKTRRSRNPTLSVKSKAQANDYSAVKSRRRRFQSKKLDDAGMASFSENNAGRTRRAANGGTRQSV
jgi:aminopeptidase N